MEQGQGRRSGGRAARQAARTAKAIDSVPFLTRKLKPVEVLDEEGLTLIEANADRLLAEVGVEVHGFPAALEIFRQQGAEVHDTRVRFPEGLARRLVKDKAPASFVQHARNPERSVRIGDPHLVFAPAYGSPFVRDLDRGRRYATIADFQNFARLTHLTTSLHHGGGTLCEPVDLPVNKRHFDMVFSHIKYHDRPFMGSVTAPERAQDTVDMVRILFGDEFIDQNTVLLSLCNANSPMSWDYNMLGSAQVYAQNNQACLITPFILAGAMAPVTVAGTVTQTLAEALAGMAFCQMVRPGAPVVFGSFASSISMQSGAPTFGTPEPALVLFTVAALARRLGVPFRSGGNLTASKTADYQSAFESAATFLPTIQAGTNFVLHTAGWLEGLTMGYEKFILDADQAAMAGAFVNGVDLTDNGQAIEALIGNPPGQHFLGNEHTLNNFETAFWRSRLADNNSFEQWQEDGSLESAARANADWKRLLQEYQAPNLDEAKEEQILAWINERKSSFPDSDV